MSGWRGIALGAVLLFTLPTVPLPAQESGGAADRAQQDPDTRYYVSNDLGMPLESIGWYRRDEFPYILEVQGTAEAEVRTLRHEGAVVKRWEESPGESRYYVGTELRQLQRYDKNGLLLEEQEFEDGVRVRRTLYFYEGSLPRRSETYGSDGQLLHSDSYRLSPQGQLRRVSRAEADDSEEQHLSLGGGGRGIVEERYGSEGERRLNRYDRQGRLIEQEYRREGRLVERRRLQYRGERQTLLRSQVEEIPENRITVSSYDEQGMVESIEVSESGKLVEETVHLRDEQGRIVATTLRGPRGLETWEFEYGEQLLREEYRVRGELERITHFDPQARTRREELYRDGKLFMRVYYEGEQKQKEEFLKDGAVVRVREYR